MQIRLVDDAGRIWRAPYPAGGLEAFDGTGWTTQRDAPPVATP